MIDIQKILLVINEKAILYLPKALTAIITLILGLWIIKIISRVLGKRMTKLDESLKHFLVSLISITLKILLFISVISMFGVQMTSFIALVGAAGLAVGLALQGSLGNFAGGVLILMFKPFIVGDVIEAQGHLGKVNQIQIFNTILKTPDNKTVIIPNGNLSNGDITNYSTEENRRVDVTVGIGYGDDIPKAKKVIEDLIKKDKRVLKDPKHEIRVVELGDSSVNLQIRLWAKGADYFDVLFDTQENVKIAFDKKGISIPFPQRDVHLYKH